MGIFNKDTFDSTVDTEKIIKALRYFFSFDI